MKDSATAVPRLIVAIACMLGGIYISVTDMLSFLVDPSYDTGGPPLWGLALIGIPANSGSISLHFEEESWKSFENIDLSMNYAYTGMRNDLLADNLNFPDRSDDSPLMGQDFLAPPGAYSLVGMDMSAKRRLGKTALRLGLSVDNLLNSVYRDYLDRQRYFSDAMGRNVKVKIGWEF